jgi:hypothetical protein
VGIDGLLSLPVEIIEPWLVRGIVVWRRPVAGKHRTRMGDRYPQRSRSAALAEIGVANEPAGAVRERGIRRISMLSDGTDIDHLDGSGIFVAFDEAAVTCGTPIDEE